MKKWLLYSIVGVVVLLVVGGIVLVTRGSSDDAIRTVRAEKGDVKQDVSFTGKLVAKQDASLGFETGGTISQVYVTVGEEVQRGQQLVRIDSRLASLELAQAKANSAAAQEQNYLGWQKAETDYTKTKAENARSLVTQQQAVKNAKTELDQQRNVVNKTDTENGDSALTETSILSLKSKESAYATAQQTLLELQKTIDKTNTLKQQTAAEAKAAYNATVQASGTVAGMSSLAATQALASVRLSKTVITAPFDGVVTFQDVSVGEYVAPGTIVAAVATTRELELTADVPETDAAKLFAGASADVTFDVYGGSETWSAEVVSVAPAAKVIEGVPTFEVKLQLISSDPKFRPGLTANITVHAAEKKNVVAVPRRAIITRDGKEFVKVKEGEGEREIEVRSDLLGSDGRVEIVNGLAGDEEIIVGEAK